MRIGLLSPIAWRTPPIGYGPWESVVHTLAEGFVAAGHDVTLFATADSLTSASLVSVVGAGYETDRTYDVKVFEAMHIARCFEHAATGQLDIISNHFDFLPLAFSRLVTTPVVTTIHGFSSPRILPIFQEYADSNHYVAISESDRHPDLPYAAVIHHGIDPIEFPFSAEPDIDGHLLFFGRIHPDKGTAEAIRAARGAGRPIRIAGIIHDHDYFDQQIRPLLGADAVYIGEITGTDRGATLGAATALLHPIAFDEPFGLSIVEAMMCGTPTIAYRRGSMPEIIDHGVNGALVADLTGMIDAIPLTVRLDRGACRQHAELHFSAARMVRDYDTLLRRIVEQPDPTATTSHHKHSLE